MYAENEGVAQINDAWEKLRRLASVAYRPEVEIKKRVLKGSNIFIEEAIMPKGRGRGRMYRDTPDNLLFDSGEMTKSGARKKTQAAVELQAEIEKRRVQ